MGDLATATWQRGQGGGNDVLHLGLGGNPIGDAGAQVLGLALAHGLARVEWLSIHESGIGPNGARHIAAAIMEPNSTLRTLSLWGTVSPQELLCVCCSDPSKD